MKRMLAITLFFVFLFSIGYAESGITFQNIEWLCDEAMAIEKLKENGLIRDGISIPAMIMDNSGYIAEDALGYTLAGKKEDLEEVTAMISLEGLVKGKIAGYPLKDIKLTFAYDGAYQLISIRIDLINASYDDLKEKLTKVYGEGKTGTNEDELDYVLWEKDKTGILLLSSLFFGDYTLVYGRLDAEEILQNCLVPADPADVAGL